MNAWIKKILGLTKTEEFESLHLEDHGGNISENLQEDNTQLPINSYLTDAPIDNPEFDQFRRFPFSQRIAETILSRQDQSSIVIGIYGAWGEGKTSVLRFIERELKKAPDVIVINFNPWRFPDDNQLLRGFFNTLASALNRSLTSNKERIGELLNKYAASAIPSIKIAEGVEISLNEGAKELGQTLASVDLDELKKRLEKILQLEGKRIVILMDDIDRLDKAETQTVFKLIKLTADFEYTAYVLAMDEVVVASALGEKYGAGNVEAGRNFLEKIIQVPLKLPHASTISLRTLCFQAIDQVVNAAQIELSPSETQKFVRAFIKGLEIRLQTPRMAKRYTNALMFALPILKGEVNPIDLMLIEGIRVFHPSLYDVIRRNPRIFLGQTISGNYSNAIELEKSKIKELIAYTCSYLNSTELEAIQSLLTTLFPRLESVYRNTSFGSDWDATWNKEQRIASADYFDRYFSYTIPEGDVSDQQLEKFFDDIQNSSEDKATENLQSFIKEKGIEKLISKLRGNAENLSSESSRKLALAIAKNGHLFPNPEAMFSFLAPFSQAAMCIHDLAKNIPAGQERFSFAAEVLRKTSSLPFANEAYRWLRAGKEEVREFSETEEKELGYLVAEKIKLFTEEVSNPLYIEFPKEAPGLLVSWSYFGKSPDEARIYVTHTIEKDPSNAIKLLQTFLPLSWGLESGISSKSDFERNTYDSISRLVDPDLIYTSLLTLYGEDLATPEYYSDKFNEEEKIAHQFSYIHQKVKAEQEQSNPSNNAE